MADFEYAKKTEKDNTLKARELISGLPPYVADFMRGISNRTTARTRVAYAYDLCVFFDWLHKNNSFFAKKDLKAITLEDLEGLAPVDFEEYMEYLKTYTSSDNNVSRTNDSSALHRKLSSLSSLYKYLYRQGRISSNPVELVNKPKLRDHEIIRLEADEIRILLDNIENGEKQTARQKAYNEQLKVRDLAILTLFLGTGIRVSELVGLNLQDIDYRNASIMIYRKGGKTQEIYFSDEVESALYDYLDIRERIIAADGHENALFLSSQKKRISVRAVEDLVKKYARTIGTNKRISPHKLRSSYGTALYHETQDIYLVADVLGHSDVNTTKKHYSAISDDLRRSARGKVRLRTD